MTTRAEAFERWIRTSFVELNTELENLYFAQAERAAVIGVGGILKTALQDAYPQLTTPLQSGVLGSTGSVPQYGFDPAKGSALLTADGWKKSGGTWAKGGKQLSIVLNALTDSTTVAILQALQAQPVNL